MSDLEIREIHLLRGPNIWSNRPVLEAWVDSGSLKDLASRTVPGFLERLKAWLPGLAGHGCTWSGGFPQQLESGACPAHILEHVTLELQTLAGHPLDADKACETRGEDRSKVLVGFHDEVVVRECLCGAREILLAACVGDAFDVAAEITRLQHVVDRHALGPSTNAIVAAAKARAIPWRRLQEGRSLIQLGQGAKQRRVWTAESDRTGAIAGYIAQDKNLTRSFLRQAGVPVPEGRVVTDVDDAWVAALEVGLPVVVKPIDANHGRGVYIDLKTREQVAAAYPQALEHGSCVMVERFIPGVDCRLLVVGDEMIAASRGDPEMVVADGTSTVVELIEAQLNSDPRRGNLETCLLDRINTDDWEPVVLHDLINQGYQPESVPSAGVRILVARFANWAIDITDEVHPTVREHAVIAAKVAGLDICGIDIVCEDISQPLEDQGGAIVEINASPSLLMHLEPVVGKPRPVGEAIIDMLFSAGEDGRIPVVGITGTRGATTVTRLLAHLLKASGKFLGVCNGDGFHFGGRHAVCKDGDRMFGAQGVLMYPWTEIAVCETSAESIMLEGLGYDHCQIGVVLNVDGNSPDAAQRVAAAERCVVNAVPPGGTAVLNADDPYVAGMAESCQGNVLWFSLDADNPVLLAGRKTSGRAVIVRDDAMHLTEGPVDRRLCAMSELPQSPAGHDAGRNAHILAALGAAWAYGLDDAALADGLRTMPPDI